MNPAVVHVASGREWRGGQRQVWLLARALADLQVNQVVVTGRDTELARRLTGSSVRVRPTSWTLGIDPRVLRPILQEIRQRSPVVLHAHDAHSLTLAGCCAALSHTPLVVTRRVTFRLRRRVFWKRACRIITISQAVYDALVADGLDPDRLVLIPSGLDPAAATCDGIGLRQRLGLSQNGQLALNLGALTPEKGQLTLVTAAALLVRVLPELHWAIVGEGPLKGSLQREVERQRLNDRFHLLGPMSDPHRVLADADVLVVGSTSEGFGSSVLPAMARGVPVVSTRVGGLTNLLSSGAGLLVEPENPAELANAVERVLTDSELRKGLTERARSEVGKYSAETMAERILTVYRSCAHSLDGS